MGVHVTDASEYDTHAATIRTENIRLQLFLAARDKAEGLGGDIGTAYLNAYTDEKIWSVLGIEFGPELKDRKVQVEKALYGLCASGNAFYKHLCDTLRSIGFKQSKMDYAMWYKKRKNKPGYDYLSHHVNDFLVTGFDTKNVLENLKKTYTITGGKMPEQHLGMILKRSDDGSMIKIGSHNYINKFYLK